MKTPVMAAAVAAVLAGCIADCAFAAKPAEHVILIGVDGFGARWIPWDAMPNLKAMRDDGVYAVGRCHRPTASAINWKSVFCGLPPEIHGFTKWNSSRPDIEPPPCVLGAERFMPCIFSEVRRQRPGAYTASLFTWNGIGNCHNTNTASFVRWYGGAKEEYPVRDASVFAEGARQLANSPALMLLYQGGVDSAGHTYGWGSPEFTNACVNVDANLGKFMTALKASPLWENAAVLFVADHGGLGKHHGGVEDIQVFEVPFLVCGPAAKTFHLREPVMLEDVSPTIAALLGMEIPDAWRGRNALD